MNNTCNAIHYSPHGYEGFYDPARQVCHVTVRGYAGADGRIVERGGPSHPADKRVAEFDIPGWKSLPVQLPLFPCPDPVRETFEDALLDRRDLLGAPDFRNKPADGAEKRLFAAAYDAAQKIRANATVLGVNKLAFTLNPAFFTVVDCFAKGKDGTFWLIACTTEKPDRALEKFLLSHYVFEAGGYIPRNAPFAFALATFSRDGAKVEPLPKCDYDRALARDWVIEHILETPI